MILKNGGKRIDFKMITANSIYQPLQKKYTLNMIDNLTEHLHVPMPSQWAEDNRYIPPGVSDRYGPFDPEEVPHLIQPLNDLHPDSPYTHITNIKSVQSANTTTLAENGIGFYIKYKLGNILYLTTTKGSGAVRGSANIDVMIDNSNLAECLKPFSNRTGRKNKDNTLYKEFSGGIKLMIGSYGSIADLKSNTFHFIIEDELDEAGTELKDQGDIEGIIEGRTLGVTNYKILQISTSSRAETSRIYRNFLLGDQNEYFTPCPICGEKQMLVLKGGKFDYGLTFTREKDKKTGNKILIPETVRYQCKHCGKDFREAKKPWMLKNGVWIPQSVPEDRKRRSYHSPGLISPFLSWQRVCQSFIDTNMGEDLLKFKDFTINVLGNPWMAVKKSADWENLKARASDYSMGEIPKGEVRTVSGRQIYYGGLLLFAGCDVQGDRLELCVTAFGPNGHKWIADYQIFYGDTSNRNDQCWQMLSDWVYYHEYRILDKPAFIEICSIDAGWSPDNKRGVLKRDKDFAEKTNMVYDFVAERTDKFIATMGDPSDKAIGILKESRISDVQTYLTKRYMVAVSLLKEIIMGSIEHKEGHNVIMVPKWQVLDGVKRPVADEFYKQFLSERYQEIKGKPGVYGWVPVRARNEVLDTFIYSWAAAAFYGVDRWTDEQWGMYYYGLVS